MVFSAFRSHKELFFWTDSTDGRPRGQVIKRDIQCFVSFCNCTQLITETVFMCLLIEGWQSWHNSFFKGHANKNFLCQLLSKSDTVRPKIILFIISSIVLKWSGLKKKKGKCLDHSGMTVVGAAGFLWIQADQTATTQSGWSRFQVSHSSNRSFFLLCFQCCQRY